MEKYANVKTGMFYTIVYTIEDFLNTFLECNYFLMVYLSDKAYAVVNGN